MAILWGILLIISFFSILSERLKNFVIVWDHNFSRAVKNQNIIMVFCIFIILSLFAGLRSEYNDTNTYMYNFVYRIPDDFSSFRWSDITLGENPGFFVYQVLIKLFISQDPQFFILISSFFTIGLFLAFYNEYTPKFSLSIFLYITSGLFVFSMAAIKQTMAMAIGLLAVHYFIKGKSGRFFLLILLASTIHPYVLLYLLLPLFSKKVWSTKIVVLLLLTIFIGFFFEQFISIILNVTENIGENYKEEYFIGEGVSNLRLLVFSVTSVLSFIFRKKINEQENIILNLCVNASIISFLFMIMASYGTANMFGRMANYFEPFTYIALPWILTKYIGKYKIIIIFTCIFFYCIFFYYQYGIAKPFTY